MLIPVYLALVSVTIALVHLVLLATPLKKYILGPSPTPPVLNPEADPPTAGFVAELKAHINTSVKSNGGVAIWAYKVARLIGCIALMGVSIAAAVLASDESLHTSNKHWGKHKHKHKNKKNKHKFSDYEWLEIALALFYVRFF